MFFGLDHKRLSAETAKHYPKEQQTISKSGLVRGLSPWSVLWLTIFESCFKLLCAAVLTWLAGLCSGFWPLFAFLTGLCWLFVILTVYGLIIAPMPDAWSDKVQHAAAWTLTAAVVLAAFLERSGILHLVR